MMWVAIGVAGLAALWWFWLSGPSDARVEEIRRAYLEGAAQGDQALEAVPKRFRIDVLYQVMRDFLLDDAFEAGQGALDALSRVDPLATTGHVGMVVDALGAAEWGIGLCDRALEKHPNSVAAVDAKARILAGHVGLDEALALLQTRSDEPDLMALRAELLLDAGQADEARELADRLESFGNANRNALLSGEDRSRAAALANLGSSLRRNADAELDPDFDPLVDLVRSGELAPRDGFVHWRVGRRIVLDAEPREGALGEPLEQERQALARLEDAPSDLQAQKQLGQASHRRRDFRTAVRAFQKAVDADATDFVAQLGLGAALRAAEERWGADVGALPEAEVPCSQWFPEYAQLTADERRVVAASVGELAPWMHQPLHIRPLEHVPKDPTTGFVYAAELFDFAPESGWWLARHVAASVYPELPEDKLLELTALLDDVRGQAHLGGDADIDDLAGFFAWSWARRVHQRWLGGPEDPVVTGPKRIFGT